MSGDKCLKHVKRLSQLIPDSLFIQLRYFAKFHRLPNLRNPVRFSEKLQWLKLNDRQPIYSRMVDKYEVKVIVRERLGDSYVVPNLGIWGTFDEIDFDALPEQFVLKCTHDSGGIVICNDRATFDFDAARRKINHSLGRNYYYGGREWPYRNVVPRVLAERYLPTWNTSTGDDLKPPREHIHEGIIDYKFYCFNGEPTFLYVSRGLHDHATAQMDFLTLDWKPTSFSRSDYARFTQLPDRPSNLEHMIEVARELAGGIPFVRVDLFQHLGKVIFSEMTFTPVSGMMQLDPPDADAELGNLLVLPRKAGRKQ